MQRAETTCALVLLVLAGLVAREALRLEIGWGEIGPKGGFFPFWLAVLLGVASLTILVRSISNRNTHDAKRFLSRQRFGLLLTVLLPIALVVPSISVLGFYLTAFFYLLLYVWWTGKQHWTVNLTVSVLFPIAIYLIFEKWFLIPLPKGTVEPFLPF